jgi:hypothetical protein
MQIQLPNARVIFLVALTICVCTLIGVSVEGVCVLWKIPDMNTPMSSGFTHVVDTLVGAAIAMLINTRTSPSDVGATATTTTTETTPATTETPATK